MPLDMAGESYSQRPLLWRFSLRGLISLMTLLAFLVWVLSWSWDRDERLILGLWIVGVTAAIYRSYRRKERGIGSCVIVGGLFPAVAYLGLYLSGGVYWNVGMAPDEVVSTNVGFIVSMGALLGGILAAAITPRGLYELPPSRRDDRRLTRLVGLAIVAVAATLSIGVWTLHRRSKTWKPHTVASARDEHSQGTNPPLAALSGDGSLLAATIQPLFNARQLAAADVATAKKLLQGRPLRIWDLTNRTERIPNNILVPYAQSMTFSPDGKSLALVQRFKDGISIRDSTSGKESKFLAARTVNEWDGARCIYSRDGTLLAISCWGDPKSMVQLWRVSDGTLIKEQAIDGRAQIELIGDRFALFVMREDPEVGEVATAELLELSTLEPLQAKWRGQETVMWAGSVVSPDGLYLGAYEQLVELRTGRVCPLSADIYAFARGGKYAIGVRNEVEPDRPLWLPDWFFALPFVRHCWRCGAQSQIALFETATGREICASPWSFRHINDLQVSTDGRVVAAVDEWDEIHIWGVPN
jgi:hypothetical protein